MPALPSVPNVIRTVLKSALSNDIDVVNIIHHLYTGSAPSDAELATLAGVYVANWIAHLGTLLSSDSSIEEVSITDLSSPTAAVGFDASSHAGTGSGGNPPAGMAMCIGRKIARRYRGGHSRVYIAGCEVGQLVDAQTWLPAYLANVVTAWTDFENVPGGNMWAGASSIVPVNVSYYSGFTNHTFPSGRVRPVPNLRPTPLVDLVLSYVGNPKVASQRRRNLQSS